jgi:mono/diheme cytochrome c family protein
LNLLLPNKDHRNQRWGGLKPSHIFFVLLIVVLASSGCGNLAGEPEVVSTIPPPTSAPPETSVPSQAPDLAQGAVIFGEHCTECHGVQGEGNGPLVLSGEIQVNIADFTDPAASSSQTPGQWFGTITRGNMANLMPPWSSALAEAERWDVAMYTYTLSYRPETVTRGQVVWETHCAECHGADGSGSVSGEPPVPDLTDQSSMVLVSDAMLGQALTGDIEQFEHDFTDILTEEEREGVIWYLRTLTLTNADRLFGPPVSLVETTPAEAPTQAAQATVAASPTVLPEQTPDVVAAPQTVIGTVRGTIQNGSPGGGVLPNMAVQLFIINDESTGGPEMTLDTVADAEGRFVFEDVPIREGRTYWASVFYEGAFFDSTPGTGDISVTEMDLPIVMYETIDDPSVISISAMYMREIVFHEGLLVVQFISFENNSDSAYIADKSASDTNMTSVQVTLPVGAQIVEVDSPNRYIFSADGRTVIDTLPVLPGQSRDVGISYILPFTGETTIEFPVNYTTIASMEILAADPLLADADNLISFGRQELSGSIFQVYQLPLSLQPGETIRYEVREAGTESSTSSGALSTATVVAVLLVAGGAVLISVAVYLLLRDRRSRADGGDHNQMLINELVREIGDLDRMYQAGQIAEEAYQEQRQRLKARLAKLMKNG